jgi:hypothetical protein
MAAPVFFRQLSVLTFLTAFAIALSRQIPLFDEHQTLYWIALLAYFAITLLFFIIGRKLAVDPNANAFTLFAMGAGFAKLALTMAVLVGYLKFADPASKYFILPFIMVYLVFTVFETYVLMKVGKAKPAA